MAGVQTISLHQRRPRCRVLWFLVLELQPAFDFMLLSPQAKRREGKKLRYSLRLSEVAIARHRRSLASLGALRRTIYLYSLQKFAFFNEQCVVAKAVCLAFPFFSNLYHR